MAKTVKITHQPIRSISEQKGITAQGLAVLVDPALKVSIALKATALPDIVILEGGAKLQNPPQAKVFATISELSQVREGTADWFEQFTATGDSLVGFTMPVTGIRLEAIAGTWTLQVRQSCQS